MNASAEAGEFDSEPGDDFPPASGPDFSPVPFDDASLNHDLAPRMDGANEGHADGLALTDSPSLVPPIEHEPHPGGYAAELDPEEADSYVARRARLKARRQQSKRASRWTAVILVLFAFNVALIGARSEVVRYLPQTASLFAAVGLPVNLRNLKFDKVKITKKRRTASTS